jgi:hypothetical protein
MAPPLFLSAGPARRSEHADSVRTASAARFGQRSIWMSMFGGTRSTCFAIDISNIEPLASYTRRRGQSSTDVLIGQLRREVVRTQLPGGL